MATLGPGAGPNRDTGEEGYVQSMELNGTHKFAAPPQAVWDALHNGAILKNAIPGADEVAWQGNSAIAFRGSIGAGPVNLGTVAVQAQVVENSAPNHLKIAINRTSASGTVTIDLAPDGAGTLLRYVANAQLSGPAAVADNFAMRPVIDGVLNRVFSSLDSQIS